MKRATVYQRKGKFFLHAESRASQGGWVAEAPFVRLDVSCSDRELGDEALAALRRSREWVKWPRDWAALIAPLLDLAGTKSWYGFERSAICVMLEGGDGRVRLIPTEKDQGFVEDEGRTVALCAEDPAAIGRAIKALFDA